MGEPEASHIKVAVRVRPFNERELKLGGGCVLSMAKAENGEITTVKKPDDNGDGTTFTLDKSMWSFDAHDDTYVSQEDVFKELGEPVVENALHGYNSTIFAYGQTGSGKTYTMMGVPGDEGLIPRLGSALFERIEDGASKVAVECAYFEIYSEKVYDLLSRDSIGGNELPALRVRESPVIGPYVAGLKSFAVENFGMVQELLLQGSKSRHIAATSMNAASSRSHAVFVLKVKQTLGSGDSDDGDAMEKTSLINLVDLAGSERQEKTQTSGVQLKEGVAINKSLSTLGMVINALVKSAKSADTGSAKPHVPYRDSVLTWILRESFGGNSKTVMVATVSPALDNCEETLSTLRYADNAKQIVNKAVVNESAAAKIIRELKEEIERLRARAEQNTDAPTDEAELTRATLADAERQVAEREMSFEARLQQTRDELEERVLMAEAKAATAAAESERLVAQQSAMKTKMTAMKWRANAHVRAVERKFSTESDVSEGLQVELEKERVKAEELQKKLDVLEDLSKLDVMSMTEYQNNIKEIELLEKFINSEDGADNDVLLSEIAVQQEKTKAHQNMHLGAADDALPSPTSSALDQTASEGHNAEDKEAGAGINPFNPFAADLAAALEGSAESGADADAARKIKDMERQLQQAKQELASAGGGGRGAGASRGGAGAINTPQGQAIYKDLLMRRRALFAVSRGLKPRGQVCLRTYTIMTCPVAPQVLAEGASNLMHGSVRLNNVACAGTLQKKGKNRHNWLQRWFLFDLRHRKVVYFEDSTLKKEHGCFEMKDILHVLKPPSKTGLSAEQRDKENRKLLVITPKRTWHLMAPTVEARELWMAVFHSVITEEAKVNEMHHDVALIHGGGGARQ
eukprot:m.370775 g.370775  ORF g.370775 m.370775 type:complete len:862 (+) comp20862_c0_seq1:136-2721(+)